MLRLSLAAALVGVASAEDLGIMPSLAADIDSELDKTCGSKCVGFWHSVRESNAFGQTLEGALEKELTQTKERYTEMESHLTSFMSDSSKAKIGIDDVCTTGRLGTMATYQSLNIGVHTLGVVTKAVCACVDVYTASVCLLRPAQPIPCEQMQNLYNSALGASNGAWQAVKASTAMCKVAGDPRAQASFLARPELNIHVADTRGSFLGGEMNRHLLSQLLKEANTPGAKEKMNASLLIPAAARFAKKESTSDYDRDMAGSLITLLSGKPIIFQSSDAESGSYGHTNIVVPSPARIYG